MMATIGHSSVFFTSQTPGSCSEETTRKGTVVILGTQLVGGDETRTESELEHLAHFYGSLGDRLFSWGCLQIQDQTRTTEGQTRAPTA